MPSLAIHFAVGVVYTQNFEVIDKKSFREGIKAPDILALESHEKKEEVHYSDPRRPDMTIKQRFESKVNLYNYLSENEIKTDFDKGYYIHLLADYYFFSCFVYKPEFETKNISFSNMYEDYEKVALDMENKYGVDNSDTPWANRYKEGDPVLFTRADLYAFIDICGHIDIFKLRDMVLQNKDNWREEANNYYDKTKKMLGY